MEDNLNQAENKLGNIYDIPNTKENVSEAILKLKKGKRERPFFFSPWLY